MSAVLIVAVLAGAVAHAGPVSSPDETVAAAIVAAVRARMGREVDVTLGSLRVRQTETAERVTAVPDAGSRVGGPMRLLLLDADAPKGQARRIGSADAVVTVHAAHVVARAPVTRRQVIAAGAVQSVVADVGRAPLQPWPGLDEVLGSAAKRDLRAGDRIASSHLARPTLVKSGDEVTTIARVGTVEVRSRAKAGETGALGESVRVVVNRKTLRGRVVGAGEVEVMP